MPQHPEPAGGAGDSALARCVACTADVFATENWGRAPRLTRAAELPRGFDDLLNPAAVDELVSRRGLRTPFLRMAKDGSVLANDRFTRGGGAGATINDQVADDKVLAAMADGATLVLQALHRSWPPLVDFASRLADELGHAAQVNAYITPPQNQGFAPHYDVHDVFVLQVSGRKRWIIHEPVVEAPLDNQPWDERKDAVDARAAEDPVIDTVLEPGDALYLPRGTIHSAAAQGETSIHLTVGVHPLTRYHLVQHLLEAVQDDPELRTSLPMGADLDDPDVLAPILSATLEALRGRLERSDPAAAARHLQTTLMSRTRPEAISPLAQLDAAAALDAHHAGAAARTRCGCATSATGDGVRLVLLDRTVTLPAVTADAVKTILSRARVHPGRAARPGRRRPAHRHPPAAARGSRRAGGPAPAGLDASEPPRRTPAPRDARPLRAAGPAARGLHARHRLPRLAGPAGRTARPLGTRRAALVPVRPADRRHPGGPRRPPGRARRGRPAARPHPPRPGPALGAGRHPRRQREHPVGHLRPRRRPARPVAGRPRRRAARRAGLPGLRPQQARRLLRAAGPARSPPRSPNSAPGWCWNAATSAATGSPPTSWCCRPGCSTAGCCRSPRAEFVRAAEAGEVIPGLLRGRIGLLPVAQAAVAFCHEHLGLRRRDELTVESVAPPSGGQAQVRLRAPSGPLEVTVLIEHVEAVGLTCADPRPGSYLRYRPTLVEPA